MIGAVLAAALVALGYHATKTDPGIGGGLIAIGAAIVALPAVGVVVFVWLSRFSKRS
jgi:hypothetical protein